MIISKDTRKKILEQELLNSETYKKYVYVYIHNAHTHILHNGGQCFALHIILFL